MKKLLVCAVFAAIMYLCSAAYLQNVPLQLTQPDGCVLNVLASGDEYYNWVHDQDNYTILQSDSGWYVYAVQSGEDIVPGVLVVGKDSPLALRPGINRSEALVATRTQNIRDQRQEKSRYAPSSGTMNNLLIFIKFAGDTEIETPFSTINNMCNATGADQNSLKQYYHETSYNQLSIDSSFLPSPQGEQIMSYTDIHPRGYFMPSSPTNPIGYDSEDVSCWLPRERELLSNAINALIPLIPSTLNVDADGNGYIDNLCFFIKGGTTAWATLLWPHMSYFFDVPFTINGAAPDSYNLQLEDFLLLEDRGTSVLAHEMFHSIGAPDLYRYVNDSITPVGVWDLMANTVNPPQQTGAWMKYKYGHWITAPTLIYNSGSYTLSPLAASNSNIYYRINSWKQGEYYLLEYRKRCNNIDSMIPSAGLVVYRMLLDTEGNANGPPDELYIYRPGASNNSAQGYPNSAALSAQNGFTAITEATCPSGFTSTNAPGGLNLYDVGESGATISFKIKISDIQLTSPVGGDIWASGGNRTIRWKAKNSQGNVKLEFSANLGLSWITLVESTPNNGSFLWQELPTLDSDQCLIKVSGVSSYFSDTCTYPFSIISTLAIPAPIFPAEAATGIATNPRFSWHRVPGATSYSLQVSELANFSTYILNIAAHPDSCYLASGLAAYTTYFWRVASSSGSTSSGFCDARSFSTSEITDLPAVPNLVSPANNAVHQSLTPLLSWSSVAYASNYRIQLARDAYYTTLVQDTLSEGQNFWRAAALSPNTIYYWRVIALNVAGNSNNSSSWRFTTGNGSALEDITEGIVQSNLQQNFPNPFNPQTRISLSVSNPAELLKVNIYNLRGQQIKHLYNGLPTGFIMNLLWDGCDENGKAVSSGIYLYTMESGTYLQKKKMLLLK